MTEHYVIEIVLGVVGFFIIRTLNNVDKSIATLNETVQGLELSLKDRPNFEQVKHIAVECSEDAVKDHIIDKHGAA